MKYMGSKRVMLRNGLGELLLREASQHLRFVDLFSGSGAVSTFVATQVPVPVVAFDLQGYGAVLAGAVLERTHPVDNASLWKNWKARAGKRVAQVLRDARPLPTLKSFSQREVLVARKWCAALEGQPLTNAYGGHYFSPVQGLWLDALRATVGGNNEKLLLAALLDAASECAAAPGHTAQPFQPTETAKRYLADAWSRGLPDKTRDALAKLCSMHALKLGQATQADANEAAAATRAGDLVFVDPPYSALQYSRFYHVLESVVSGHPGPVEGVGRYPRSELRPSSSYSVRSKAMKAMDELLGVLAGQKANVVITFPDHDCSNGLSGASIKKLASTHFRIAEVSVKSRLSTLGGAGQDCIVSEKRGARRDTSELILLLKPN